MQHPGFVLVLLACAFAGLSYAEPEEMRDVFDLVPDDKEAELKRAEPGSMMFGKRTPTWLAYGRRSDPDVLRFGKRVLGSYPHFGKRPSVDGLNMRFGRMDPMEAGRMRFGRMDPDSLVTRFGKRAADEDSPGEAKRGGFPALFRGFSAE